MSYFMLITRHARRSGYQLQREEHEPDIARIKPVCV
jgi:hypothetical protein